MVLALDEINRIKTGQSTASSPFQGRNTTTVPKTSSKSSSNPDQKIDGVKGSTWAVFPFGIGKYFTLLKIANYNRESLDAIGKLDTIGGCILPLPMNLVDNHQVMYESRELGVGAGAASQQFGLSGGGLGATILAGGLDTLLRRVPSAIIESIIGQSQQAGSIAGQAGGAVAGSALGSVPGIAYATYGISPNEFVTILLRSPVYKRHTLKFKLAPRNFEESAQLRHMLNILNNAMAPGYYGPIFTFPKIFEIAYLPNPGYLYKFKPCVLETMTVNYSASGAPAFYRDPVNGNQMIKNTFGGSTDNAPEAIDLQLNFIELEYWVSGDFKETNDPYDGYARKRG